MALTTGLPEADLAALLILAASIGVVHTLAGPDHYVPFIAMSRTGRWSYRRTVSVALLCAVGHVLGSVLVGAIGIATGLAVAGMERFESLRGNLAAWLLLGFGLAYAAWAIRRAMRGAAHAHVHAHADGTVHSHAHDHRGGHAHAHTEGRSTMTAWILFTIFIFGPCEPLIPLLMAPAAELSVPGVLLVTLVFGAATIGTLLTLVTLGYIGITRAPGASLTMFGPVLAGLAMAACGGAMLMGL
jgi:ABC-type nickel/cobalt efflux system permease component RcnA